MITREMMMQLFIYRYEMEDDNYKRPLYANKKKTSLYKFFGIAELYRILKPKTLQKQSFHL